MYIVYSITPTDLGYDLTKDTCKKGKEKVKGFHHEIVVKSEYIGSFKTRKMAQAKSDELYWEARR